MLQIKHSIFSILVLTMVLFTSCFTVLDDKTSDEENKDMQIPLTRVSDDETSVSGKLIFWKSVMTDFFTEEIEDLNAYDTELFDTGKAYPTSNVTIKATGFSPSIMTTDKGFQKLTLPTNATSGLVDVCCSNTITGSYSTPFNTKMTFDHTLTKISFIARRDAQMLNRYLVNNIRITIPSKYLPKEWNFNASNSRYVINNSVFQDNVLTIVHSDPLGQTGSDYLVATCFLMLNNENCPDGKVKGLKLIADITKAEQNPDGVNKLNQEYDISDIQLYTDLGVKETEVKAGYAYEIAFNFTQDSFILTAIKKPWEKGGLITVPIDPRQK